jgi:methylphosphotriester-DNA--protein-cysteine methyltransferase
MLGFNTESRMIAFREEETRWAAFEARDRSADGAFFACVVTTGIYCKPSCAARPLRKNVTFAATKREAEANGFRACKRCKP